MIHAYILGYAHLVGHAYIIHRDYIGCSGFSYSFSLYFKGKEKVWICLLQNVTVLCLIKDAGFVKFQY